MEAVVSVSHLEASESKWRIISCLDMPRAPRGRFPAVRVIDYLDTGGYFDRRGTAVSFFGGEPLVNFPVLRGAVERLEEKTRGGSCLLSCNGGLRRGGRE